MAANELVLVNAATQSELKLEERAQFYHAENEVIIGDLYRDPYDPTVAVISVLRKVELKELAELVPEAPHNRRADDANANNAAPQQKEGELTPEEKDRLDIIKKNL